MNTVKTQRHYDQDFKQQAVALIQSGDKTIEQIAQNLGMPTKTLACWRRQQLKSGHAAAPSVSGLPDQAQILALKAQLKDVALERDILKKALAICSQWKAQGKFDLNW